MDLLLQKVLCILDTQGTYSAPDLNKMWCSSFIRPAQYMATHHVVDHAQNRSPDDGATHLYCSTLDGWLVAIPANTPNDTPYPQDGAPQGCVIIYTFPNSTSWLSFFVTTAAYRGHGLGRKLFKAGIECLHRRGADYVGLDSVAVQRGTYARRGFVETNLIAICERSNAKDIPDVDGEPLEGERLVDLAAVSFERLAASDLAHSGLERTSLWTTEALFQRRDATGLAVMDRNDTLKGWILVRRCELGYRFGPVYADRKDVATLLLHAAIERLEDRDAGLIAEVWHSNEEAISTFKMFGWKWTSTFHRMWYKGKQPLAQSPGGQAEKGTYAIFDAAQG